MIDALSMNCNYMNFEISFKSCPMGAVWAEVRFFTSMGEYMPSKVLGGLKTLAAFMANVSLGVGAH